MNDPETRPHPDEIVGWTDGRHVWHAGCISLGEEDVEFRALFGEEEVGGRACDTCGEPLARAPGERVRIP